MENKNEIFKDPEGYYALSLPSSWKYIFKKGENKVLNQFTVDEECIFQISSSPLEAKHFELINSNELIPNDLNLPNISFVETYRSLDNREFYYWSAIIGNRFYLAIFFFNLQKKQSKKIGLELLSARLALQNIIILKDVSNLKCPYFVESNKNKDYQDIENWKNTPKNFKKIYSSEHIEKEQLNIISLKHKEIEVAKVYALLTLKISHQPNGFFSASKIGKPLDNPIWWDFIMESDKGYIQIWRTVHTIEIRYSYDGEFDVISFFKLNIKKYLKEINKKLQTFEKHVTYINHYQSYHECTETLWEELLKINITPPTSTHGHLINQGNLDEYRNQLIDFRKNSVKFHALAKSFVLNSAFKIESFLNLIIRIGSRNELKLYPEVLKGFLNQNFNHKLKNLNYYTRIFKDDLDLGDETFRRTLELMNLRNKYVHNDEDKLHNKLGEVYFDRDIPLFEIDTDRPAVETIKKMYHNPNLEMVKKSYSTANDFTNKLVSNIHDDYRESIVDLTRNNPISYNEKIGIYSSFTGNISLDFFTELKSSDPT
ncbi:hypothetical protein ACF3OC_12760 [Sphingobacterium cellulitidis]|uniref:hypothetical protein n=1 Tax=Sphingobacterium cellulitidis TaxID=1768011 RepID=UPI00370DE253